MAVGRMVKDKNHNPILHFTLLNSFHKMLFSISCLGSSGVELQVLPFIDNRHLGSIHHFQQFSCLIWDWPLYQLVLIEVPV